MEKHNDDEIHGELDKLKDLDFSYLFNEGLFNEGQQEAMDFDEEDENADQVWQPRFPVDMENPAQLTDLQKERALRIYNAITKHLDEYPHGQSAPLIGITQDWDVRVDFGGWVADSDYRDTKLLSILSDETLRDFGPSDVLIAIDSIEESIYPIPADMEHDDYGGIIQYVRADTLVNQDGSINVGEVKALVNRILNPRGI